MAAGSAAHFSDADRRHLARAIEIARLGQGHVEPNPMVGCVIAAASTVVGEGWHQRFGGPHAEIEALRAAGDRARGAAAYVSLEPCAHAGKTPPCTAALLAAGVARVVVGAVDPNPLVNGNGLAELRAHGVEVEHIDGDLAEAAADLMAPFRKLVTQRRPWIIAKWAMTLDGKIAAADGSSRWISGDPSRAVVHALRGRVDAVLIGRGTAQRDDPLLTTRPAGPRVATRIVLDSAASLAPASRLVQSAAESPVMVAAGADAPADHCRRLRAAGVEVWQSPRVDRAECLADLLDELGRRQMTNVLVEGGAEAFGSLLDLNEIDEIHAFVAPKIVGGAGPGPIRGRGLPSMADALPLMRVQFTQLGDDGYWAGRVRRP